MGGHLSATGVFELTKLKTVIETKDFRMKWIIQLNKSYTS